MDRREALKGMGAMAAAPFIPMSAQGGTTDKNKKKGTYKEIAIACLLENQRRHNPKLIPEMRRLFTDTHLWDLVSIQPSIRDEAFAYYMNIRPDKQDSSELRLSIESEVVKVDKVMNSDLAAMERSIVKELHKHASCRFCKWTKDIKECFEGTYIANVEISNVIHRKNSRGDANRIITSPEFAFIYESASAGFDFSTKDDKPGIVRSGSIANRWRLYKDELFPKKESLIFYKGDSHIEAGCIFVPFYLEDRYTLRYGIVFPRNADYVNLTLI